MRECIRRECNERVCEGRGGCKKWVCAIREAI